MELVHDLIDPREVYSHIEDDRVREACIYGRRSDYITVHRQRTRLYDASIAHQRRLANDPRVTVEERRMLLEYTHFLRNNLHDPDLFLQFLRLFWLT
ncbi:hypothetical protein EOD42_14370 [Rhodovarius crocodyli]|uniref:Uncharacterized protein n=1 Tax=Rhodovarius crocodyli TaxID=1979269 RepID=A0A437MF90_9PROT|nr:hypothetical protein [Rhodovarius crocodyli]RVT96292.1 hypothetical protein EOD42_14370 [Rhodovarius crocodyli]